MTLQNPPVAAQKPHTNEAHGVRWDDDWHWIRDPNYLLTEDWIPEVPGINAPGDYLKDYAPNPGDYAFKVLEKTKAGTYDHYFPGAGTQITYGAQPQDGTKNGAKGAPATPAKTGGHQ